MSTALPGIGLGVVDPGIVDATFDRPLAVKAGFATRTRASGQGVVTP
ncbi:hypothetical protein [Pseudomonas sp.]|nr:hypothetical protein [Pseudomonas sp.]